MTHHETTSHDDQPTPHWSGPQPTAATYVAPVWGQHPPVPHSSRPGLVIAVISLVVSGIALLAVVGLAALMFVGGGMMSPMTGQVRSVSAGASLSANALTSEVTERLEQDGWTVEEMTCPQTPKVDQGVVAVCHGVADGGEWAFVVFFEDADGSYTLTSF